MEEGLKKVKRQRSENWLEEDKIILKELVKEGVSILENKNTDANTNAKKVAEWHDLSISFNNMAGAPRTLTQIKAQWCIIKMSAKKKKFIERKERCKTGGGPPPPSEPPSCDDIAVWLPNEFTVDCNEFDSDDQTFQITSDKKEQIGQTTLEPKPGPSSSAPDENSELKITEMILEPNSPPPKTPKNRLNYKKMRNTTKESAILEIAKNETACRKELHEAQMANEKQKLKNLLLKEEVLKYKLLYYKNKLK